MSFCAPVLPLYGCAMTNSVLKTCAIDVSIGGIHDGLLSINGGQEAEKAIESASLLLDSVVHLLDGMPSEEQSHITESASTLAHLAKSLIDSIGVHHE